LEYNKPGDVLDLQQPVLFNLETKKQVNIDNTLFPNPFSLSPLVWWQDSRGFTFEYNQRGHQVYRIIEVEATAGTPRAIISEEPDTFFPIVTINTATTLTTEMKLSGYRNGMVGGISTSTMENLVRSKIR